MTKAESELLMQLVFAVREMVPAHRRRSLDRALSDLEAEYLNDLEAKEREAGQRTGHVTESIYSGKGVIVPLADVQHIETHNKLGLHVVTKHTRWDCDRDVWANPIWIDAAEAEDFKRAWCRYRHELEQDTLADLTPTEPAATPRS